MCADKRRCEADLERTFKKFTTKPVTQVALVTEYNLLFMLAGKYVFRTCYSTVGINL